MKILLHLVSSLWFFSSPASAGLTVGSAISMSDAITEIVTAYERQSGRKIRNTFSGTNVIARQIEAGAPIDVFVSADTATMAELVKKKLISQTTIRPIATNNLVVVVSALSTAVPKSPHDLLALKRIAIADPTSVPAGIYAKKWLTAENLWQKIQPKTIPLPDVRAALIAAGTSNADAAIVYLSDARSSQKVHTAFIVPLNKSGPIEYLAGVIIASPNQSEAARFLNFLTTSGSRKILARHGFSLP